MLPIEEAISYLENQDVRRISEAARRFGVNKAPSLEVSSPERIKIASSAAKTISVHQTREDTHQTHQQDVRESFSTYIVYGRQHRWSDHEKTAGKELDFEICKKMKH
jgi:hypothetical protein